MDTVAIESIKFLGHVEQWALNLNGDNISYCMKAHAMSVNIMTESL